MKVTVAIPTVSLERLSLLLKAIESIQAQTHKDIHIVIIVDDNSKLYNIVGTEIEKLPLYNITVILNEKHTYWVSSVNRVWKEFDSDYYVYAADDVTFPSGCIANAVAIMEERFPDGFGLVNLFRRNKVIFGLFGRKFADHFPERQVLCPDFIHYGADREITEFVNELDIYASVGKRNYIKHHPKKYDETWRLAELVIHKDPETRRERRKKGYKWGIDFNLVRK
ncbi:glycosyltransferase family 2 protein [bacterium]|nr:glycosyltransferase family 2 protein [bacterium]